MLDSDRIRRRSFSRRRGNGPFDVVGSLSLSQMDLMLERGGEKKACHSPS